jgi:hypothetical protein
MVMSIHSLQSTVRVCLALGMALLLCTPRVEAAERLLSAAHLPGCTAPSASSLVYALAGSVYRVDPDGRHRCRLTLPIQAKEPHAAPNGRWVAFLSGAGSTAYGRDSANTVRVIPVGGARSAGVAVPVGRGHHAFLAWSPDGRMLAFLGESGVWVWRIACRCVRLVVPGKSSLASFAWSPDSRRLAVYLMTVGTPPSTRMTLAIADLRTGRRQPVVIHFPAWFRGNPPRSGSYPSRVIAWLPGHRLLLGMSGFGAGLSLTSIWMGSPSGVTARLVVGTPRGPRLVLKYPLLNTTQALVSPDGRRLLLDPGNHLWIGSTGGGGGRQIDLHIHGSCVLAQSAWVGNAAVAYTTVCTVAGTPLIRARLYGRPLSADRSVLLAAARSPRQDALSLAPPTRCIACGAG